MFEKIAATTAESGPVITASTRIAAAVSSTRALDEIEGLMARPTARELDTVVMDLSDKEALRGGPGPG